LSILKLIQMTDLHLGPTADYVCRNFNTLDSFKTVLKAFDSKSNGKDMVVLTGDLASDSQPGAYQQLNKILTQNKKQAIWLPGNHDDMLLMQKYLSDYPYLPVYEHEYWAVLMIDSSVPGKPGGEISSQQLEQLEHNLERLKDKLVLVAMHHSPVSMNSLWLDEHRISNHQKLHSLLVANGNVKAVITGHVHQQYETEWEGIRVYSTPSTCFQFAEHSDQFTLSDKPPAYRWLELHSNGHIDTGINRVDFPEGN
jgi:Icc protein